MYKNTNKQILEEIARLSSLRSGKVIGRNRSGRTTVTSLGKFRSEVAGRDLHIGLKEYCGIQSVLDMVVATELGLIDLVEENLPHLVDEFPLFHGIFLDKSGKPIGVVTEDFSKNGTARVESVREDSDVLPHEIQKLIGRPDYLDDLATTCFIVDGRRRIGDFGEFTMGSVDVKMELAKNYFDNINDYSVKVALKGR